MFAAKYWNCTNARDVVQVHSEVQLVAHAIGLFLVEQAPGSHRPFYCGNKHSIAMHETHLTAIW